MNEDEFRALVLPHREAVARFVASMVGREAAADAEDIVQETFAVALRDRERFEGRSKASTWLYGIALNLCRRHLRERARRAAPASPEELDERPGRLHTVLSSVVRREVAERLETSIGRLPTSLREAFLLKYLDGMDYGEIAAVTGVSEGTARVRAFRARALLRQELGSVVDSVWLEKP